jgi:PII-like signaling protein
MKEINEAILLRIYVGEADKFHHKPLYTEVVESARKHGLAGATAWKGLMAFGANSVIHTSRLLDLSADLPVVVEIIDEKSKIDSFCEILDRLFAEADAGALVTVQEIEVRRYFPSATRTA